MSPVKATDYNWIQNGGFEDAVSNTAYYELVPNGFQNVTDEFNEYASFPYIDVFDDSAGIGIDSSSKTMEHFTFENLPSTVYSVDNVSLVIRGVYISVTGVVRGSIYDTDTDEWVSENQWGLTGTWQNVTDDYSDTLDSITKVNNAILKLQSVTGNGIVIDAVCLKVGVHLNGLQTDINSDSYPWFSYWDNFGDESYIGITDAEANSGDYSAYLTYLNSPYKYNMHFDQRINYLAIDNFTTINFYAKTDSTADVIIQCWVMYSDLTSEYDSNSVGSFNSASGWTEFNFTDYSATGKIIIDIYFMVISGDYGDRTYFDDIGLHATVQSTTSSRFSWYTIPDMNISQTGFSANALTKTNYVFYGTFYNSSGSAVDSGTFTVKSSKIDITGTVSYGQFNFDINERGSEYNGNDELFTITLNIDDDGIYVFKIYINWFDDWSFWDFTPPPTNQPPTNPYGAPMITVIVHLAILIMPSAVFAGACFESKSIDPIFGIIAGLTLSAVLYYIVFNNILLVIICVVVMGFLLFGKSKSGNSNE